MRKLFSLFDKLTIKLPLIAVASALLAAAAVTVSSHLSASSALVRAEANTLEGVARYRAKVLEKLASDLSIDIGLLADSPTVRQAFEQIQTAYHSAEGGPAALRAHYTERRLPQGQKRSEYRGQEDRTGYGATHGRWHPILDRVNIDKKFYDVFFVDPQGEVIYSVEKSSEFGTNLRNGRWRNSGLARAFEDAASNAQAQKIAFSDYEVHEPNGMMPAAFMARAMLSARGELIGVIAVELPNTLITTVIGEKFGETGTAYVVGQDGRLRMNMMNRSGEKVLTPIPRHKVLQDALNGQRPVGPGVTTNGQPALLAASPARFFTEQWVVMADMLETELHAPINKMGLNNAGIALLILLGITGLALWLARGITRPINQMRDAVSQIASGENVAIPGDERGDELGELARSLTQIHAAGVAAAQIKAGLDNAGVNVMIADSDGRVTYANKAMIDFLADHAPKFRKQFPGFSAEDILGATVDQFHRAAQDQADGSHKARLQVDTLTIELSSSPILDADGSRLGVITEWRNLTDELIAMAEVADVVAAATKGNFSARIQEDNKAGLIKNLAAGQNRINTLVENAMQEFSDVLGRVADGDLMARTHMNFEGRFAELAEGIDNTVSRLADTVATIQRSARDINAAATEINAGSTDLAKRTEEEAASLEETAATTEQLAASVKQTATSSRKATQLSDKARLAATEGGMVVNEAINAMARIEEASRRISEIIGVIDDIAFQTNLLALNAAVEAARAGEAGKGFAVVASEVRTLAQRSGQAARDIKELIIGSAEQITEGVKLVRATGQSLEHIVTASTEVAETVVLISSASTEQANGIEEMSNAVARIDEMTQQNSALAEESAASATELMSQIDRLNKLVSAFRIDPSLAIESAPAAASEPDRLRRMAAEAFAQSKVTAAPEPARMAKVAGAGRGGRDEWSEF